MIQYDKEISERLGLPLSSPSDIFSDTNNNKNSNADSTSHSYAEKYSLRPRSLRKRGHHSDEIEEVQSKSSKPRKSTLLSKYRRKTANARERNRMREINQAFETLRRVIPDMSRTHTENEKVTKITTLRLAMKYISTLTATLSSRDSNQDIFSDCSEMDCFLLESDGDSLTIPSDLSDHSVTPADFTVDFSENSLDFTPLSPELPDQLFDPFLMDFS